MDQAHLHLLIVHLPIYGSILGAMVLIIGLLAKSGPTNLAAYVLFIVSTIGACMAYLVGEGAEEAVEGLQGVSEASIEGHEEFAAWAFTGFIILGLASLVAGFITLRGLKATRLAGVVVLLVALVCFGLVARTGYLGGQIRHKEIGGGTAVGNAASDGEEDD